MKRHTVQSVASAAIGRVSWVPDWRVRIRYSEADGCGPGEFGHPYFVDRHVDPRSRYDWGPAATRESAGADEQPEGCHVSGAALAPLSDDGAASLSSLLDWPPADLPRGGEIYDAADGRSAHQRDWDYLEQTGAEVLQAAGVDRGNPRDVVEAFAAYAADRTGPVYPTRHPVDVALHSSYCDGKANLLAALCLVFGIPARTIQNAVHTMVEVFVDNQWSLVDNIGSKHLAKLRDEDPAGDPRNVLWAMSFTDVVLHRWSDSARRIPGAQAQGYTQFQPIHEPYVNVHTNRWHFNQAGNGLRRAHDPLRSGAGVCALPSPDAVAALYPARRTQTMFAAPGDPAALELTPPQGWFRASTWLDRGEGLVRQFYIGSHEHLAGATHASCDLQLVSGVGVDFDPVRGGWDFFVNGTSCAWRCFGLAADRDRIHMEIPLSLLEPNAVNEIALVSSRVYGERRYYKKPDALAFWLVPDLFGTHGPWYLSNRDIQDVPVGPAHNTHSAWHLYPDSQ